MAEMKGLLDFYSLDQLTPEERYQAVLRSRIGEAQFLMDSLNTRLSDYPRYSDYYDSPLTTYPIGIYRGLLELLRGEDIGDMADDSRGLLRYIQEQSRSVDRQPHALMGLLPPEDIDDVPPLPKLRSR